MVFDCKRRGQTGRRCELEESQNGEHEAWQVEPLTDDGVLGGNTSCLGLGLRVADHWVERGCGAA